MQVRTLLFLVIGLGALRCFWLSPFYVLPLIPLTLFALHLLLTRCTSRFSAAVSAYLFGLASVTSLSFFMLKILLDNPIELGWYLLVGVLLIAVASLPYALLGLIFFHTSRDSRVGSMYEIFGCKMNIKNRRSGWPHFKIFDIHLAPKDEVQKPTLGSREVYARSFPIASRFLLVGLLSLIELGYFFITPWILSGYAVAGYAPLLQWVSVFGAWGVGILLMLASIPFTIRSLNSWIVGAVVWLVLVSGGVWKLHSASESDSSPSLSVSMVQPGIVYPPGKQDRMPGEKQERMNVLQQLNSRLPQSDVVVWPEYSFPYPIALDSPVFPLLTRIAHPSQMLVFGAERTDSTDREARWNSMFATNTSGKLIAHYDKRFPMPFGEYVPFSDSLRFLGPLATHDRTNLSRGTTDSAVLDSNSVPPFYSKICYEAMTPWYRDEAQIGKARWAILLTSDAWFAGTFEPELNLDLARIRAVEANVPVVRASKSGSSAFIDRVGNVTSRLDFKAVSTLTDRVVLSDGTPSFYFRFPWLGPLALLFFCFSGFLYFYFRARA